MTIETRSRLQGMLIVLVFVCGLAFGLDYAETRRLSRDCAHDLRSLAALVVTMSTGHATIPEQPTKRSY